MSRSSVPGGEGPGGARSGERSEPGRAEPGSSPPRGWARSRRHFTTEEKRSILAELAKSGEPVGVFGKGVGISTPTLYTWRKLEQAGRLGEASGRKPGRPRKAAQARRTYNPDQRRQAVEAYLKSGMTRRAFAKVYGVAEGVLSKWVARYEADGPKALEDHKRGRPKGSGGVLSVLPQATKLAITTLKARFPDFGLRKIRDFLHRFHAIKVSPGSVRKTLTEAGVPPPPVGKKRPKKKAEPWRWERAKPNQLWQSDITSFVLTRHHQRVYLVVFMDDCSRYIVSFGLHTHQKAEIVQECLLDGIARFGKPKEVLTDQGPQYFAWRGKAAFQKLLVREGIEHAKARTHHPETVGKCERFWETVNAEFWDRCHPQDLTEARLRLNHFIAHYNHFRPHQGINGVVPADRFFGAEAPLRKTIESKLAKDEIQLALNETPRKSVYLFGQIGEEQVSLHGEGGRIVIQTPDGGRREMALEDLGIGGVNNKELKNDEHDGDSSGAGAKRGNGGSGPGGQAAADTAVQEADEVPAGAEDGLSGQVALGRGDAGGAGAGAQDVHGAPGTLAREGDEGGGDGAAAAAAAPPLAAVTAGALGYGGGAAPAAEETSTQGGARDAESRERREGAPQEECGAREGSRGPEVRAGAPAGAAGEPGKNRREPCSPDEGGSRDGGADSDANVRPLSERAAPGGDQNGAEGTPASSESRSARRFGTDESRPVSEDCSQGRSE